MLIEDWDVLDAFYMTAITITTTGFKEVFPLSMTGKIFTVIILVLGISAIAYTAGRSVQILVESHIFRRRRMDKMLTALQNHYIVCGYGRMGTGICEHLKEAGKDFVVIENNPPRVQVLEEENYLYIDGDSTSDEILLKAGIERAKGMVTVLSSDAENVFAVLTARGLNHDLYIVARAIDEGTESKLKRAGANRVVKPYDLGGTRLAELLLRPGVIEFMEIVRSGKHLDLNIEEVNVVHDSALVGKTLMQLPLRKILNIIIVAISKEDGNFIYNPQSNYAIEAGDKLMAIGSKDTLLQFDKLCLAETDFKTLEDQSPA